MSRRVLLRAGVLAGSLFLLAGLTPQTSTLMSAQPPAAKAAVEKALAVPTGSLGTPTNSAELRILGALTEPTTLDFIEEPLQGVVDYFKEEHGIEIQIDARGLEDVGLSTDEPVTRTIEGISLRSALDLVLGDFDLTWTIVSEVLLITTPEQDEVRQPIKVYDVADLVLCRDENGQPWDDYETLVETIASTVAPETWEETTGGPGCIEGRTFASAKVLVIRQTCQVHLEVARLLDTIRTISKAQGKDSQPPVRKRRPPKPVGMMGGMGGMSSGGMGGMGGGMGGGGMGGGGMGGGMGGSSGGGMFSVGRGFDAESEADPATGKAAGSTKE